jgi:hypothetical protein
MMDWDIPDAEKLNKKFSDMRKIPIAEHWKECDYCGSQLSLVEVRRVAQDDTYEHSEMIICKQCLLELAGLI